MKPNHKISAFALSELLCVLAILAILAAILFPTFSRARKNAARTNCQSNLRAIGLAWLQYARDSDNTMMRFSQDAPCDSCVAPKSSWLSAAPTAATPEPTAPIIYWWGTREGDKYDASRNLLRFYLAKGKSYSCPAFAHINGGELGLASYGYNAGKLSPTRYGPAPAFAPTPRPAKLSALADAARTVAFADAAQLNSKGALRPSSYLSNPRSDFPNFHARHKGAGNVLFCDGHVAAMPPTFRPGAFATYAGLTAATLRANHLGDIDADGDLTTDELFNGTGKP